jgi:hypothetical protein
MTISSFLKPSVAQIQTTALAGGCLFFLGGLLDHLHIYRDTGWEIEVREGLDHLLSQKV